MGIKNILPVILSSVPFALLCVVYKSSNLKREERGYQFASMFLGLLYTIAAISYSDKLSDQILSKLKYWAAKFMILAEQKPQFATAFRRIADFINTVNWEIYMIFIINFLALAAFMIIKRALLPVFKSVWKNENLFNATSGICYEWSDARRAYVLKPKCFSLRAMMNVYYSVAVVIVLVLINACRIRPEWHGFNAVFYPFAIVIILGEIVFFLGGKAEMEFADDIGGDGGSSYKVVNYYRLRKYLTMLFGDRIIAQDTKIPKFRLAHNNSEIVKKYENIDIQEARIANLYFKQKNKEGVQLDEGYVEATYRLMNGESMLFANPFYKDFSDYIFLPLNRAATKENKILFILGQNGIEEDVAEWISESFLGVTSIPDMWEIGRLNSDAAFGGEVGIVTPADIFSRDIVSVNSEFLNDVSEVVMIEPSLFVGTSQLSISLYISEIRKSATFYIIDKNSDGLVDTMSHIVRQSIKEVSATTREKNRISYMLWKADGEQLNHRIFPNVARYLGVGTELMIAGIRNQVKLAEWYSYSKFPVTDMKWISGQYYQALCEYASLNPKQEEIEKRMHFNSNIWSAEKADYKYLVVEDEACNVFEMSRQFSTRGRQETFVNVVAQNYMLRDYMEYNSAIFEADPKAIPAFCPDYSRTERNIVIELLMKLSSGFVSKEEILKELQYIEGLDITDKCTKYELKSTIYDLVFKYFKDECAQFVVTETTLVDERNTLFTISNSDFINAAIGTLKCAYYVIEDEESEKHYLDAKLLDHVYQAHLPGQFIVIGGRYYEVLFISADRGVVVKRAADSIHSREYYRQLRHYNISSFECDKKIGSRKTMGNIVIERGFASFDVQTEGYILMSDYGDLNHSFRRQISNIPGRSYNSKNVLKITLPQTSEKIRTTVCILLNEVFKTTYPDNCNYVCAVTKISDDMNLIPGIAYTAECEDGSDNCIYILEDSILDLGLISSVERNLKRFFEIITDFLKWYKAALLPVPKKSEYVEIPKEQIDVKKEDIEQSLSKGKKKKRSLKDLFKRKKKDKKKDKKKKKSPADKPKRGSGKTRKGTGDSETQIPQPDEKGNSGNEKSAENAPQIKSESEAAVENE